MNNNLGEKEKVERINKINPDAKRSMINRIIVAIVLVLIVGPCIVLGDYVYFIMIFALAMISCHEIIMAPQSIVHKYKSIIYFVAYMMMILMIYWIFIKNNLYAYENSVSNGTSEDFVFNLANGFTVPQISLTAFFISIGFFFLMVVIDPNFTINDAFYFISMLFIVSIGYQSMLFLRYYPFFDASIVNPSDTTIEPLFRFWQSAELLLFVLLGNCMNDVGAYFIGVLFGKHKMTPRISPKKTWEGFAGGVFISILSSLIFAFTFDAIGLPLTSFLDMEHWYNVLIIALLMPLFATLGDLMFSCIKRNFAIKDFGTILKSHGGILDRVDSIIFTCIGASLLIVVMANNWIIFI